ncbi:hypothetical protein GCM10010472_71210 [Pseudonocardia halophobica]|uniref:Uncharacterized protein n=1 Tax=Pseudonocardia halophobica TaxID=29401 RepID=A0A9W6NW32_9PSEU|nr:hypothetical protein [Pseudonocardia halophobica]GLL11007.1 hypothetical protein GCM10017577_21480 [Pseudonocardia halophobica]
MTDLVASALTPDDLEEQVSWFEGRRRLSMEEYRTYFALEVELETRFIAGAAGHARCHDFGGAAAAIGQVVELNRVLLRITHRELAELTPGPSPDREELTDRRDRVDGFLLLTLGIQAEYEASQQLALGDLQEAKVALQEAVDRFEELAKSGLPYSPVGSDRWSLARMNRDFLDALALFRGARYESAHDKFREAAARYDHEIRRLREQNTTGYRDAVLQENLLSELADRHTYARVLRAVSAAFTFVQKNDFEEAAKSAEDAVGLGERWLDRVVGADLPEIQRDIRSQELCLYQGWAAWIEAERAIDRKDWTGCDANLRAARDRWTESTDLGIRNGLRGVVVGQADMGSMELLLLATRRRRDIEERLGVEIDRLRRDIRDHAPPVYITNTNQQGDTMTTNRSVSFSSQGDMRGNFAGESVVGATYTDNSQSIESGMSLRELAKELAELRDSLAPGVRSEQEKERLEHVRQAEEAARAGDEKSMKEHLAAAGKWALAFAEKLALSAAEVAIRASIGA